MHYNGGQKTDMEKNNLNNLIDGRAIATHLFNNIAEQVSALPFKPVLCDVIIGDDPVSWSYVKIKRKKAQSCGMEFSLLHLPADSTEQEIIDSIQAEQTKPNLCGLIVQLPLPKHLNSVNILNAISPSVDVDVINSREYTDLIPPTAGAILQILLSLPIDLAKEKFLVLGQGELVGKPITKELRMRGYTVDTATKETLNKSELLRSATVIITGVGKAGIVTGDDISSGAIIIDAGTSESAGSITGDVDFESVVDKVRFITPSPGGVGPVTVAKLLENVLEVAKNHLVL